jgi:hypothetical protein
MTAPRFNILTQKELVINLSRPAMEWMLLAIDECPRATVLYGLENEIDNFYNVLQNLLERSEPEPENLDLIGD